MASRIEIPDLDNLIDFYLSGVSEKEVAERAGVNRWTFRKRLEERGIAPRGRSESMSVRMSRASREERLRLTAAAHDAVRGKPLPLEQVCKRAAGKERTGAHIVPSERQLAEQIEAMGLSVTLQKAVGPYNIDVAVEAPPIAVEVFGGNWHAGGRHRARFRERTEYLLDRGWSVVVIWVDGRRYPLGVRAAQYVVSLAKGIRSDPSGRCKYRVILGDGQPAPRLKSYLNSRAFVPAAHRRD